MAGPQHPFARRQTQRGRLAWAEARCKLPLKVCRLSGIRLAPSAHREVAAAPQKA